jgi:superfamily II DNA or RNA helicase
MALVQGIFEARGVRLGSLIRIDDFDNFREIRGFPAESVSKELQDVVRNLDEREELEPFIRSILFDTSITPHGPAEIVDILTHKVSVKQKTGLAAFIIKGKSFAKVRPVHVAHQIYRLEKIVGLEFSVFVATGVILDGAKEQFCSTAERLGVQYAIFDTIDLARLFVSHGFLCPRDARRIIAGRCQCGYSPKKRIFNVLQRETLKVLTEAHNIGQYAGLVVLPPGTGKTRIAAEDAKKFGVKRVLYIAHTQEILDVAQSEFEAVFNTKEVTRHSKGSTLSDLNKVNIATIQLVHRNLAKICSNTFDYLVMDEFHHAAAKSYRKLIDQVKPTFLLGLTATPFRKDRQDILRLCEQNVLVNFELRIGIETGILSPYHYFGCFDDINYSNIRHNGFRYDIRDLERALVIPERDGAIIRKWKEYAEGKPTLAFCCSHRHAYRVSQSFKGSGIPAEVYLSSTTAHVRDDLINKLQLGDLRVLCVVDIMNEGADLPFIECLLFLRPTESQRIFYQQLGRGLRRYVGKSHCIVIDFIGNFKNAYKVVEFQGLLPFTEDETFVAFSQLHNPKEILNLPLGCEVFFDDRVIDIFARQTLDPAHATRHNIGRILVYQYTKLNRRLGHRPTRKEVDRNLLLSSELYKLVFSSWKNFEKIMSEEATINAINTGAGL